MIKGTVAITENAKVDAGTTENHNHGLKVQ